MYKIGDRVIYANKNRAYGIGNGNPLVGTKYFCEGIIARLRPEISNFDYSVDWDNGASNVYQSKDLELVTQTIIWEV